MSESDEYCQLRLPTGRRAYIPKDITIELPEAYEVPTEQLHLLAYIPWDDRYYSLVPKKYREFFKYVLPYLGVRTTDVHTAFSVAQIRELIHKSDEAVDAEAIFYGVILHDCGWQLLNQAQIATSLDYSGLYAESAREPKLLHAKLGAARAIQLMRKFPGGLGLTRDQESLIYDLIWYHDRINLWPTERAHSEPPESPIVTDADALWSFTHENFWLDTIRKNVKPHDYVDSLAQSIVDNYIRTPQGKAIARRQLELRRGEVAMCPRETNEIAETDKPKTNLLKPKFQISTTL